MSSRSPSLASATQHVRATLDEPRLLQLLDYWAGKCRDGRLPGRPDIDPLEMRFILGNLLLVDVERAPLRFRYRLVGINMGLHLGGLDMTGRTLDEHPDPTFRAIAQPIYSDVAETGVPRALRHDTVMDGRNRRYQVLLLPLARDGETVDMILVGMCFDAETRPRRRS